MDLPTLHSIQVKLELIILQLSQLEMLEQLVDKFFQPSSKIKNIIEKYHKIYL